MRSSAVAQRHCDTMSHCQRFIEIFAATQGHSNLHY